MIFLPNKHERYISALRNLMQKRILKYGAGEEVQKKLKKILFAGISMGTPTPQSVDIIALSDRLLGASVIIYLKHKLYLSTTLKGDKKYLIDPDIFSAFLLEITVEMMNANDCRIELSCEDGNIKVIAKGESRNGKSLHFLAKKLSAIVLKETSGGALAVSIPAPETDTEPIIPPEEWEYISDPLSIVNVILSERLA